MRLGAGPNGYPIPDPNPKFFSIPDPYPIYFQNLRVFRVSGILEKEVFGKISYVQNWSGCFSFSFSFRQIFLKASQEWISQIVQQCFRFLGKIWGDQIVPQLLYVKENPNM